VDALAFESHFLDHLAPIWHALPVKGRFLVDRSLVERARARGIEAESIDAQSWRNAPQQPPNPSGTPALVASIGDIKIGRRLGYGPFAFLEHGAGQSYQGRSSYMASYAGGPDRSDNELFLVPNEYSARLWRKSYPNALVEIVGSSKLDSLPRREGGGPPVVALSFHGDWPTGVPYGGNALGDFATLLPKLAAEFNVIGHCHPGRTWPDRMARTYAKLGIEYVPEFEDVCRRADVYVCDNSSTIFEFASTGRPVVLLNARHWQRGGGPGLRFWDAAHVGINVWPDGDLVGAIHEALEDAPAQQVAREDALRIVYGLRTNGAAAAAAALNDWLATRNSVAA
jgi:hypothetical protein